MKRPDKIYDRVIEIDERIRIINKKELENGINYAE